MMLEYHNKLDRGRVFIPSKCRHHFESGLELALDDERRFIAVHPSSEPELKLDASGRLAIPKALRVEVNITDTVVVVGVGHYLEIWNPLSWQKEVAEAQSEADRIKKK